MLINYALVPRVFPGLFVLDEWMVGKHVLFGLWNIILIAFLNFLYYAWLEDYAISPTKIFSFIIITTSVGIFPLTLMVFINELYLSDRHNRHASVLNQKLESLTQVAGENHNQKILLRGSSENDSLELLENDLLYIQAMENYCLVHFLGQGRLVKHLLRSSLKNIDDQLEAFPHMLRCHRSYLVNRKNISRISGNARAYAIHFEVSDETIPVSRTINKDQLLNSIS